jgi:POT family proton-dependent oligopeptide transporter
MSSKEVLNKTEKQPKGLYFLFAIEAAERFQYYGMRAILVLFLTSSVIDFSRSDALQIYGFFIALCYLSPLFGGLIADKYIGQRRSILIGGSIMAVGEFILAGYGFIHARVALWIGLTLIVVGNGFFKSTISSVVGFMYKPNDPRLANAFGIFYMGINLGALFGALICGQLGESVAWRYGFLAAGITMLLSTLVYYFLQQRMLGDIGLTPVGRDKTKSKIKTEPLTAQDYDKLKAICVLSAGSVFFWAFFEQAGSSLVLYANDAVKIPPIFGFQIKSTVFQSINPMFILILTPIFGWIWRALRKRKHEPSIPGKFGWGLLLQGIGFIIITIGAGIYIENIETGKSLLGIFFLTGCYFFCTAGELCLSPVGLSMIRKLAPLKYTSMFMGLWFLSIFLGGLLAGQLASFYEKWELTTLFSVPAILSIIFAIAIWAMSRKIKSWMHGVE